MATVNSNIKYDIYGDKQLNAFFKEVLNDKQRKQILLHAFRLASKPYLKTIKANLLSKTKAKRSGNLFKSLGTKPTKSKLKPSLLIGARTFNNYKGHHAHLLEFGTDHRYITKIKGKALTKPKYTGKVKASNFFSSAYDSDILQVQNDIKSSMFASLSKFIQKHNKKLKAKGYI